MEKFTKINAEKYIRTTNDAQVAQLGHLNALIDNIQTSSTNLLVKEGSISVAEITTMVDQSFPSPNGTTHTAIIAKPNEYYLVNSFVLKINSTVVASPLTLVIGTRSQFFNVPGAFSAAIESRTDADLLFNGIFYAQNSANLKVDSFVTPFVSEDICISVYSSFIPYTPPNTSIKYKIFYQSIPF